MTPLAFTTRIAFAFSGDGRWATCLRATGDDVALERRDLTAGRPPGPREVPVGRVDRRTAALPLNDGRVLALDAETSLLTIAVPGSSGDWAVTRLATPSMLTGQVLASPGPEQEIILLTRTDERRSTIWRLSGQRFDHVLDLDGSLSGGVWLDGTGRLALDHTDAEHGTSGIFVDLAERSWRRAWSVSDTSTDRIAAYSPRSDCLAVTTTAGGAERAGLRLPGSGQVRFSDRLQGSPLAFDDTGERLLLLQTTGAISRLAIHTVATDRTDQVPGPPCTLWPPARWTGGRIHVRFSAPHRPPTLATVCESWSTPDDPAPWGGAELVRLDGPAGEVEAVVYGGPGWRRSRHLVMALHGGPLSSWRMEFDPLFQSLAAAGIAVVAPNYRGSTGYGTEYERAVIGDWGGPDLADVLHLAQAIAEDRGPAAITLLGVSYGAFLALLAAAERPGLWSGCVALAPFTSAAGLYAEAGPAVRDRVATLSRFDRDGARRDVLDVCAAISTPLLIAHGRGDDIVPVGQTRALRRRLLELGRTEGVDFDCVEVDEGHVSVVQAWPEALRETVVRFCTDPDLRPLSSPRGGEP